MTANIVAMNEGAHDPAGHEDGPARWRVVLAFAAIYIIWGSTYLGIRLAVETIPPALTHE